MMNSMWRDCLFEVIERECIKERRLAHKEFEDRSNELTENLITELNERKKAIEHDNLNMELCRYFKYYFFKNCIIFLVIFSSRCIRSKTCYDKKTKKKTK